MLAVRASLEICMQLLKDRAAVMISDEPVWKGVIGKANRRPESVRTYHACAMCSMEKSTAEMHVATPVAIT
jgi:hypothetical protein